MNNPDGECIQKYKQEHHYQNGSQLFDGDDRWSAQEDVNNNDNNIPYESDVK